MVIEIHSASDRKGMSRMKYIRKNGIKDPGSAITHGIALILAMVGTLPLLLKAAREPDHLHVIAMAVFMLSMILLYLAGLATASLPEL